MLIVANPAWLTRAVPSDGFDDRRTRSSVGVSVGLAACVLYPKPDFIPEPVESRLEQRLDRWKEEV